MLTPPDQLALIASYVARRTDAIITAWRLAVAEDPKLTTGTSLPQAQLHDHIPALLEDFGRRLIATDRKSRTASEIEQRGDAAAHGLHRWQQGFDLSEVARELGRLNECVVAELEEIQSSHPEVDAVAMTEARAVWARLHSVAISSSTSRYYRLQQMEASGHVADLENALQSLRSLEAQRAELWQQAAHDLRGNLGVVVVATAGLKSTVASDEKKATFLAALDRNVRSLHRLLEDVTSLSRLQGGQEVRNLVELDASKLMLDLAGALRPLADERHLTLDLNGPATFPVVGDATKTRRIVQNLVLNALKYTRQGGVTISWGDGEVGDARRWFIAVRDTGPGFHAGSGAPLAGALEVATEQSRDVAADAVSGEVTHAKPMKPGLSESRTDERAAIQQPGEGLGLSIVKRLCSLLDATVELDSEVDRGTTFRILFPRRYGD